MSTIKKTIFIAGGGTGGHLYPALSIGNELKNMGINIIYIGSKNGIEKNIFPEKNENYFLLNISGLQRGKNLKSFVRNITFPIKFLVSYFQSILLITKYRPSAIIGTGGYCSGLPLLAGISMNIPTYIQDQNSIPGLITKKLNKKINKIFLGYEQAKNNLDAKNCIYSGNPIRPELVRIKKNNAKKKMNFNINKKLLFIIGGSQGASPINNHILKNIDFYTNNNYQVLWQCGNRDYNTIKKQIKSENVRVKEFISDMSIPYSAADLIISRAGALAINEIIFFGKASIIIPFPHSAENHQLINGKDLESKEACIVIEQNKLNKGKLEENIQFLFEKNQKRLKALEKKSLNCFKANATNIITQEIIKNISC